jgi:hypothetical protein
VAEHRRRFGQPEGDPTDAPTAENPAPDTADTRETTAQTYAGVYLPEGQGRPVALFTNADQAQQWRKSTYGDRGVVMDATDFEPHPDAGTVLNMLRPATTAPLNADAGRERLKAELRMRLEREALDKELEEEVRADMERAKAERTEEGDSEGTGDPQAPLPTAGVPSGESVKEPVAGVMHPVAGSSPPTTVAPEA